MSGEDRTAAAGRQLMPADRSMQRPLRTNRAQLVS